MGACTSIKNSVDVVYNNKTCNLTFKNLMDLRNQIMRTFSIDEKFILLNNSQIVKSSNELVLIARSSKKSSKLQVSTCEGLLTSSKSQISIGKSLSLLVLKKYIVLPEWLYSESTIDSNSITIQNEEYQLKTFNISLDIPGLVLGKIKKSGREVPSLIDLDHDLENLENLFVLKDSKKTPVLNLANFKHLTCSLVYNDKNLPVGILSWDGKNTPVSLNTLKSSVHFAVHFTSLPNEDLPASMSNLSILNGNHIFTEYAVFVKANKVITYHLNDYSVVSHQIDKQLENFSVTQTPFGFIFALGFEVFRYNLSTMHCLPKPSFYHSGHTALFHQTSFLIISGTENCKVEALNLHSLTWSLLPDLPVIVENPASCSHMINIYVLGGKVGTTATDSVYKLETGSPHWEKLEWKVPWSGTMASAISIGKEIIIFGGVQSDKDKFAVFDNGKEVQSGVIGIPGNFDGLSMGKVNLSGVIFSRQGQIFKYDHVLKKFFLLSIGNYFN